MLDNGQYVHRCKARLKPLAPSYLPAVIALGFGAVLLPMFWRWIHVEKPIEVALSLAATLLITALLWWLLRKPRLINT